VSKNVKIIQPSFMKNKGSMCSTELWSLRDKCEYKFMMKDQVQEMFVPLKKPGSIFFYIFFKNKLINLLW